MSKRNPYRFEQAPEGAKVFWTSLEAKADPQAHQRRATAEFPAAKAASAQASAAVQEAGLLQLGRRSFMGAGLGGAMAAMAGCIRRPEEKILPFTQQPEYVLPGISLSYATAMRSGGEPLGLLVTTHEGRPTKVEGNPQHPSSQGATDGYAQAAILDLYDPDRSTLPAKGDGTKLTDSTMAELDGALDALAKGAGNGSGLRVLMAPSQSPTTARVVQEFLAKFPEAKIHRYEPVSGAERMEGARLAFGTPYETFFDLRRAQVVVALDADLLGTEPGSVRHNRSFADGRRVGNPRTRMNRLYVVEPGYTVTGASADHRLRLPARDVLGYTQALAKELSTKHGVDLGPVGAALAGQAATTAPSKWVTKVAAELTDHKGNCVLTAGVRQPALVHALVLVINQALGNVGPTVRLTPSLDPQEGGATAELGVLAKDLQAGSVKTLLILGGNPVVDAPADFKFAEAMAKAGTSVHYSAHRNATSQRATWHAPRAHEFETWGDLRGSDGSVVVQQPLISPLRGGRADAEVLAKFSGVRWWRSHPLVRTTMRRDLAVADAKSASFEERWKQALFVGGVRGVSVQPVNEPVRQDNALVAAVSAVKGGSALGKGNLEVNFAPDPALYDGRWANSPWMLELPDPVSCISWDNAAYMSQATADELGVENHELIDIKGKGGESLRIVTWILPGNADHSITVHLGWGRELGRYTHGAGFDAYPLRTSAGMGFAEGFTVSKAGERYPISQTQETHSMEGRPIAIDATLEEYQKDPTFAQTRSPTLGTTPLWTEVDYSENHKWSMVIDLATCTGCNACLVACQAENNVSSVGKQQVARGRDMYWLRLDRYFVGSEEDPQIAFQPVGCQQCEEAPCENVCPVNATAHSPEGLNDMAYNRCIGTRYCMNNCPYKVRRFNFLDYTGKVPETLRMQYNPNVSVRMRGVMEKCSYCVQRIQQAKITARREDRQLRDREITTACQQACPAGAIIFGDLNDERSLVRRVSELDRQYKLLPEVGTQPRTTYLAKIRNPNPEMKG